jgi:hypothetical protein
MENRAHDESTSFFIQCNNCLTFNPLCNIIVEIQIIQFSQVMVVANSSVSSYNLLFICFHGLIYLIYGFVECFFKKKKWWHFLVMSNNFNVFDDLSYILNKRFKYCILVHTTTKRSILFVRL